MKHIGEYFKNQEILLELLTYGEENEPIHTDFQPSAILEYYDGNGLIQVGHVTLEEAKNGLYLKSFSVPEGFKYGYYVITYEATIDGKDYITRERFQIVQGATGLPSESLNRVQVSDLTILTPTGAPTTIVMSGAPVMGAIVQAWLKDKSKLVVKTTTDAGGHWNVTVLPGTYLFEFLHPNGMSLRTLEKAVI